MTSTSPNTFFFSRLVSRDPLWWHLALLFGLSALYEWSFVHLGLNLLDEGWPLYAAKRLHEGGTLYKDVFFVFPPGHVLTAWLGYWWSPPGFIPTRVFDGIFNVSLVISLYFVGRRLMPASFAFLGALMLALATPYSHVAHFLFGYRYFVLATLGLLAFFRRVDTGESRWMIAAGLCAGIGVCFRLTPAFSLSVAVAIGVMATQPRWRGWFRDWSLYAVGVLVPLTLVVSWLAASVGLETAWREILVRPIVMTDLQSLPVPPLAEPRSWNRVTLSRFWIAIQFRAYAVLYIGYLLSLGWLWFRSLRRGEPFRHVLLLTTAILGATYYARSFGRSDIAHLESALPPVCLFLAHAISLAAHRVFQRLHLDAADRALLTGGSTLIVMSAWLFLFSTDIHFSKINETVPFKTIEGIRMKDRVAVHQLDRRIQTIRDETEPGDTILDMSFAPGFYVVTDRNGPGWFDLIMPGTFLDPKEQLFFTQLMLKDPPKLVIVLDRHFDDMQERSLRNIAPLVVKWLQQRYKVRDPLPDYNLLYPRESLAPDGEG